MAISKLILNGETQMDVTSNTNVASNMLNGVIGTKNDGTKVTGNIASKSSDDLTASGATVTAPAGYYANAASKAVATTTHPNPSASITSSTGVVTASHTQGTGYVTGGTTTGTLNLTTQAGKTVTPTESVQTAVASYRWTTGNVNVAAISSTYVGTGVTTRSSANLTANGSVVTAPAGYYSTAATKAVAAGSAFPPAVTITKAPTIGVNTSGVVTASYSGSSSITPTVTSGYVSKGTAGTISTTGTSTYQLTSKAATTYYPSTADQTVASQRWLVGNQTFKSVITTNLSASNIVSGVTVKVGDMNNTSRITQVTGTYAPNLISKTVTPTEEEQLVLPNSDVVITTQATTIASYTTQCKLQIEGLPDEPFNEAVWYISGTITLGDGNIITIPRQSIFLHQSGKLISFTQTGTSVKNIYVSGFDTYQSTSGVDSIHLDIYYTSSGTIGMSTNTISCERVNASKVIFVGSADPNTTDTNSVSFSGFTNGDICLVQAYSVAINSFITEEFIWDGSDKTFSKTVGTQTVTINIKPSTNQIVLIGYSGDGFWCGLYKKAEEYDGLSSVTVEAITTSIEPFIERTIVGTYSNSKVITIGDGAFMGMTSLSSINFPNASYLYKYAFADCSKLVSAYIPQVTYIYPYAFSGCSILRTFTAGALTGVGEYGFHRCNNLPNIDGSLLTYVGSYAFYACRSLKTFSAPLLTSIGAYAFGVCYSLSTISIPEVSVIGSGAFYEDYITQIYCPKVTSIGNVAFYHVLSLNSINLPSVTYIGDNAFSSAVLKSISMPNIQTIGNSAFRSCKSLSGVLSLPFLSSLGTFAFASCYSLLSIYCPILSVVSDYAFTGCISITSISLPSCTQIGTSGFASCYSLSAANISRCSKVGIGAFYGCSVLSWVYISVSGEAFIGRYAFQGCRSLMSVYLFNRAGYSIIKLSSYDAFTNTPIASSSLTGTFGSIYVYSYYYQSYITAPGWSNFSSRIVSLTSSEISAILSQIT